MKWASAISQAPALAQALDECAAAIAAQLAGAPVDLVIAFAAPHHRAGFPTVPDRIAAHFPGAHLLGCSGGGIIGDGREIEDGPALSLVAASLPNVDVMPMRLDGEVPALAHPPQVVILLCDPFTTEAEALVGVLDEIYPNVPKIGGMASGGERPGQIALWLDRRGYPDGAVGLALAGDVAVDTIVAQGCRAVGRPYPIDRCERNVILELGGRPPVDVLRELLASLDPADRELFERGLHVGLEMREESLEYQAGELLVRNLVGVDPESGAMAIAAQPRQWQVLQFMLRDATTADEELVRRLDAFEGRPAGALLFSCLGRGEGLFGAPDHDSGLLRRRLGPVPVGGFFCNGEIGPVGRTTFVHGYTSSFGLFRARSA